MKEWNELIYVDTNNVIQFRESTVTQFKPMTMYEFLDHYRESKSNSASHYGSQSLKVRRSYVDWLQMIYDYYFDSGGFYV